MGDIPITTYFTVKPADRRKRPFEAPNSSSSSKQPRYKKPTQKTKISSTAPSALNYSNLRARRNGHRTPTDTPSNTSVSTSPRIQTGSLSFDDKADNVIPSAQEKGISILEIRQSLNPAESARQTPFVPPHHRLPQGGILQQVQSSAQTNAIGSPFSSNLQIHPDEDIIPSSQSQYLTDQFLTQSAAVENEKPSSCPGAPPAPTPNAELSTRYFIPPVVGDYEHVVLSSQTQLLDHLNQSLRKIEHDVQYSVNREIYSETIPSSQSQEMDLIHPDDRPVRDDNWGTFCLADRLPKSSTSGMPSDAKVSIRVQDDGFADNVMTEAVSNADEYISEDGSVTESETENDNDHPLSRPGLQIRAGPRSSHFYNGPPPVSNIFQESEPSQVAPAHLQSTGESYGSLPLVLKEMFDDTDDSYPPDFPMSLRS